MKLSKWILIGVVLLAIVLIMLSGTGEKALTIGDRVPDFRSTNLSGNYFFYNDYRSNVVLLNFSATWCTYCLEELPHLEILSQKYGEQGLTVVTVFQDHQNINLIREIAEKNQVSFPVITDKVDEISRLFGVRALPFSVIIDRNSVIRYAYTGFVLQDMERYERQISSLLQEEGG